MKTLDQLDDLQTSASVAFDDFLMAYSRLPIERRQQMAEEIALRFRSAEERCRQRGEAAILASPMPDQRSFSEALAELLREQTFPTSSRP